MKSLSTDEIASVSGGKFGKDESVLAAIELTKLYYTNNSLEPSVEEVFATVVQFYDALKEQF